MSPIGLSEILEALAPPGHPDLLVGVEHADDAGVYRLDGETALVVTADYITPPVDDPADFGRIAAANSLSDVYAMGGRPLTAYNLVGFPAGVLPPQVLGEILRGALEKVREAGAVLTGGHTTDNAEPIFGLAVNGLVHPERVWRNHTARPGDALILTKTIGSGVLFNANKKGLLSAPQREQLVNRLARLNRYAAEALTRFQVNACTDITGFGLAGHAYEMAFGGNLTFRFHTARIPVMEAVEEAYAQGVSTGANKENRSYAGKSLAFTAQVPSWREEVMYDPQTSGGLLAAVPADQAQEALAAVHAAGDTDAVLVGQVEAFHGHHLVFE
ncbi:MAG: selenide, water dikinase SelD [Deltaproteobacteria bacterium]|nr:selenide, water dikinase SelD [Deltaproteobacteria bacterium]